MHRLRAYLFADPAIILSTLFFGSLSIIASLFDRSGNAPMRIARVWARSLLAIGGVRVNVEGLDQLSPGGSYVLIANHLSYMDTPVVLGNIPVHFRFLAKKGLFQIPFLGTHLSQAGHIPVPRGDPRASVRTMQLAAETIQQRGISLLIFPEGGRSHDGILQPFKEGAAYIAIRAGVPAVPIAIIGSQRILPFGSGVLVPGAVTLRILSPIDTHGLTLRDRGQLTEQVRAIIAGELDQAAAPQFAQKSNF
ncbi:MAG: lysophospholipid acyltransferase family protein [Bryobacteraceae bacterium]